MKPNSDTLFLTVHKKAFEVMVTGEKKNEYRKKSKWIESRLFKKDGTERNYDFVKITNGYSKNSPSFTAVFIGVLEHNIYEILTYSNGLKVDATECYNIILGSIIKRENIK